MSVLIVGESIGEGAGTETDGKQWFKQLQTVDKSKVSVTNVFMGGNESYSCYVRIMALNDDMDYNLTII